MSKQTVFDEFESSVQSYARSYPSIFDVARGAQIWDTSGRRYLDFLAGCGSLNYGHNNPILKQALTQYIQRDAITHGLDMHTVAKERFLEAIRDIVLRPRGLDHVVQFCGPTGTNAVEAALKLARKVTGRTNVISFTNGFHGVSMGALAATGNQYHRAAAGIPLQGITTMPFDGYFGDQVDTIAMIDRLLDDPSSGVDQPAAVIVETVQGEGGINTASVNWLVRLQGLCHEHGILLIVDDIQAGCGRTGSFFSFDLAGITPDIITLSKSLSGYGLPMAAVLIKRSLDVWKPGEHNGTFRGNNHAFVTATAALEHYWRSHEFADTLRIKSDHLDARLHSMLERFTPDLSMLRGRGMMRGLVCADPRQAAAITSAVFDEGLIIERSGGNDEVIKFLMPLTIEQAQMDEGLDILAHAMSRVFGLGSYQKAETFKAVTAVV